jgi:hypothetical protein
MTDRNVPYLTILVEHRIGGHQHVHAGLARHGVGRTLCDDRVLFEWGHAAHAEGFELYRPAGWRHRWAEAYLELNRGCKPCLDVLYALAREQGWSTPKSLKV